MDAKKDKFQVKLIIDTDPGVDDAMALGIALTWPTAEVLALTCVQGNVNVDQCCINASRILDAFGRKDVPLYKGAGKPLIGDQVNATYYHGNDGLVDCTDNCEEQPLVQLQEKHAVLAIIELAKKYKNEITLCAIGPLTNLALAVKLMPELPSYLKEVIIIGGNYTAVGNITATGEFNFYSDPAAAHVVLEEYSCPITIIPWETLKETQALSRTFLTQYSSYDNPKSRLFGKIMQAVMRKHNYHSEEIYDINVDPVAIAIALNKKVITECCTVYAVVEVTGKYTRGMMVIDWKGQMGKNPNITLVKAIDKDILHEMLMYSVK